MLHNIFTAFERANLWGVELITGKGVSQGTERLQNKWLEHYFSDEQKQKDAEAAAPFHIKAAKLVQVIIILRKFVMEKSIFVISSSDHRLPPSPPPPRPVWQHATFIYCAKYVNTYRQKLLWAHGGGGGNDMLNISIYFLVKNTVSA